MIRYLRTTFSAPVNSYALNLLRTYATGQNLLKLDLPALTNLNGENVSATDLFANKKVVVFGVPGAFTPVCSSKHVPSYVENADSLKKKGVDKVVCVSINDRFVMKAWGDQLQCNDKVELLADWKGEFLNKLGLSMDLSKAGLGTRSKRFSLLVDNGVIVQENIEETPAEFKVTGADQILKKL